MTITTGPPPEVHYAAAPAESGQDWRLRSVCANSSDPDLWFPGGSTGIWVARIEGAKRLCLNVCPVIDQCRKLLGELEATCGPVEGIWAGTDMDERNGEKRRMQKAASRSRYNAKRRVSA